MSILGEENTEKTKENKLNQNLRLSSGPQMKHLMHWRTVPESSNQHISTLPAIQQFPDIYRCFFPFPGELPLSQPIPHLFCCHQHLPGPCFLHKQLEWCHGQDLSNRVTPGCFLGSPQTWGQFHNPSQSLHSIFIFDI